jgi:hypothetical protein
LLVLGGSAPLAALALNERKARRARAALGVEPSSLRSRGVTAVVLALLPVLLGLALAQPVVQSTRAVRSRVDAQVFYTFDTSGSMAASTAPGAPTRLDRAVAEAAKIRARLSDVPSGLATMTDRVLPNIFPTTSEQEFDAALDQTIGIETPPPKGLSEKATTFAALDTFAGTNFFTPHVPHRLVILFTDGETAPYFASDLRQSLRQGTPTSFVIVHVWRSGERVFRGTKADPDYRADPRSTRAVASLASVLGGRAFDEGRVGAAVTEARHLIGRGTLKDVGAGVHVTALAQWLLLAAFAPLAFLLWRRNIG